MQDSHSSEFDSFSASQEISRFLWQPKFHRLVHKNPSSAFILILTNQIHTIQSYFLKIYFNIILPSAPRSPKRPPSFRFLHQILYKVLFSTSRATVPAYLIFQGPNVYFFNENRSTAEVSYLSTG
jgi:hypothetical protein